MTEDTSSLGMAFNIAKSFHKIHIFLYTRSVESFLSNSTSLSFPTLLHNYIWAPCMDPEWSMQGRKGLTDTLNLPLLDME